jgi:hypothetical protein
MTSKVITTRTRNIRKDVVTEPLDEITAEVEDGISHLTISGQDDLKPALKRSRKAQRIVIIQASLIYSGTKLVLISRTPKIMIQFGDVFSYPIARICDFGCAMRQLGTVTIKSANHQMISILQKPPAYTRSGRLCAV